MVGVFAWTAIFGVWLSFSALLNRISDWLDGFATRPLNPFRIAFHVLLLVLGFLSVWIVRLYIFGGTLPQIMPILWVCLWASLAQTIGLKSLRKLDWHVAFAVILLAQGFIYQTYGLFAITSANPFSMGYSEAGRHYYASIFFAEKLYGMRLPLPFLHPSRYLLLSIPFLADGLPLWFHRFWQALLWFGLTLGSAWSLARFSRTSGWMFILFTAWAFLFFFQGAVYYHLQVMVILILAGVSAVKHPGRSLVFVILASVWAGVSRVNWFPVPAMLAIAIYVLETPIHDKSWKYWLMPFIWGVSGLAAAMISQFIYIQISGNADVSAFGSSFTSELIWSRLLPNETFPMGILPGILLVSAPPFATLYQILRGKIDSLHPLRWLALLAMLAVLFIGGAIVSTKIGGGGDLHNMDAYLVMLSVVGTAFWAKQAAAEREAKPMMGRVGWGVVMAALLIPLGFAIRHIGFYATFDKTIAENDIQVLQEALKNGGEILFITERQLITFDYLSGIMLVPEYEQSELMEMAMSRNRLYLENFYAELRARRFALIVAEDQKFTQQKEGAFVEENAAWVRFVGAPLLCNYKPVVTLTSNNLQVYEPRPKQVECKDPFAE
ncbi:MAG: hypothetical protein HXY38_08240 [Chloroflexi bacterium]|nr:hypothetical protein [Chloroflexota bacterium]